jgi:uncharacterized protein (DUF3084 family)
LIDITHIWRYDRQIWGTQSPEVSLLHELGGPQVREARLIRMIDNRGMANPVFREVISAISNFVTAAKDFTSLQVQRRINRLQAAVLQLGWVLYVGSW